MKSLFFGHLLILGFLKLPAQVGDTGRIHQAISSEGLLEPLRHLSSDSLRGRHAGTPEINIAADYIAGEFKKAGTKPVSGHNDYFQVFRHIFTPYELRHMDNQTASQIPSSGTKGVILKNIVAVVAGTDPVLRNQYILLSAHYDHVGVADSTSVEEGKADSIFNGARDNAAGVAAVIAAAQYFASHPPKRSILLICYTAEEEGEMGSSYYAEHPLIPLDHTVYNLNVDNASYNTTDAVCLFGLGRTSADTLIKKACMKYGLAVLAEPEGLYLFERSDNFSLARKGIPAPNFSLGITDWNKEIEKRYHRLSDEFDNIDPAYIVKFIRSYILSAEYIANTARQPYWTAGDVYENNWNALFKKRQ